MSAFNLSEERALRLRSFRRRAWAAVGACLLLRVAGGAFDANAHPSLPVLDEQPPTCPIHQEALP